MSEYLIKSVTVLFQIFILMIHCNEKRELHSLN